jgi:hypothetical protein
MIKKIIKKRSKQMNTTNHEIYRNYWSIYENNAYEILFTTKGCYNLKDYLADTSDLHKVKNPQQAKQLWKDCQTNSFIITKRYRTYKTVYEQSDKERKKKIKCGTVYMIDIYINGQFQQDETCFEVRCSKKEYEDNNAL